jgi:hypothetical protein
MYKITCKVNESHSRIKLYFNLTKISGGTFLKLQSSTFPFKICLRNSKVIFKNN